MPGEDHAELIDAARPGVLGRRRFWTFVRFTSGEPCRRPSTWPRGDGSHQERARVRALGGGRVAVERVLGLSPDLPYRSSHDPRAPEGAVWAGARTTRRHQRDCPSVDRRRGGGRSYRCRCADPLAARLGGRPRGRRECRRRGRPPVDASAPAGRASGAPEAPPSGRWAPRRHRRGARKSRASALPRSAPSLNAHVPRSPRDRIPLARHAARSSRPNVPYTGVGASHTSP